MSKDTLQGAWRGAVKRLLTVTGTLLTHAKLGQATVEPGVESETIAARGQLLGLFDREDEEHEEKIRELQLKRTVLKAELEDVDKPFIPRKQDQQMQMNLEGPPDDGAQAEGGPVTVYESDGQGGLAESPEPVAQPVDPTLAPVQVDMPEEIPPADPGAAICEKLLEKAAAGHGKTVACKLVQAELRILCLSDVIEWWNELVTRGAIVKDGRKWRVPEMPAAEQAPQRNGRRERPMEAEEAILNACDDGANNAQEAILAVLEQDVSDLTAEELSDLWDKLVAWGALFRREGYGGWFTDWAKLAGASQRETLLELQAAGHSLSEMCGAVGVPYKTAQAVLFAREAVPA